MKLSSSQYGLILFLVSAFLFPNNTFAQDDKKGNKKVVIIKKTIDKDGNEKIEKIIEEGKDIDVDALIKSAENEKGNVEIDVEVTAEGDDAKSNDADKKEVTVEVNGDEVKIMDGGNVEIINIKGEVGTQEIKTDDGKHIIVKRLSGEEGKDLDIGEMLEEVNIEMTENGAQKIRIIKTDGPAPDENSAFLGVMIDQSKEGVVVSDVVEGSPAQKAGLQKGDILVDIDGTKITSYKVLTDLLSEKKASEPIVAIYKRGQETNKVRVMLARRGDVDGEVEKKKVIIKKTIKKEKE